MSLTLPIIKGQIYKLAHSPSAFCYLVDEFSEVTNAVNALVRRNLDIGWNPIKDYDLNTGNYTGTNAYTVYNYDVVSGPYVVVDGKLKLASEVDPPATYIIGGYTKNNFTAAQAEEFAKSLLKANPDLTVQVAKVTLIATYTANLNFNKEDHV